MCTIQQSGFISFVVNLVTWLLCHQIKMHEGCWVSWHSKKFLLLLLWSGEFYFNVVGNFELKKITSNFNALAKSIISYFAVSYFLFVFLDSVKPWFIYIHNNMQCRHLSVWIALCDLNKRGVEIGERHNQLYLVIGWIYIIRKGFTCALELVVQ